MHAYIIILDMSNLLYKCYSYITKPKRSWSSHMCVFKLPRIHIFIKFGHFHTYNKAHLESLTIIDHRQDSTSIKRGEGGRGDPLAIAIIYICINSYLGKFILDAYTKSYCRQCMVQSPYSQNG